MPAVKTHAWAAGPLVLCALLGCPQGDPAKPDAGPAPAPFPRAARPAPTEAGPLAVNDFEIQRYPDEKPINHVLGTTHVFESDARTQASATLGTVVAKLSPGTPVDEISERSGWMLVVFIDPKDPTESRREMGWLADSDFIVPGMRRVDAGPAPTAAPPRAARPLDVKQEHGACPGGYGPCGAMCRLECRADPDCVVTGARCYAGYCLAPGAMPCAR
jgi:hypothetical protein